MLWIFRFRNYGNLPRWRFKIGGFELCWFKIGGSIVVHAGWPEKALSSLLLIVSAAAKTLLIEAA